MARKQEDIFKDPIRDGNRGGLGLFKWESIKQDKYKDHYLGSSVKAAFGRWQNNKDLDWYKKQRGDQKKVDVDEIEEMKRLEQEAMQEMLGVQFKPKNVEMDRQLVEGKLNFNRTPRTRQQTPRVEKKGKRRI